jgi:hydroxymethylbilane synthase
VSGPLAAARPRTTTLRLGTRRSALALAQAELVAARLRASGVAVDVLPSVTAGDRSRAPLDRIGGQGVFVADLRGRLLAGEVDLVVHSAKDLPAADAPGLAIAAVPSREDPRDGLVAGGRRLAGLPPGATVGTGSPRRAAQLRRLRPDLRPVPVRGNVDTRLRRLAGDRPGSVDALLLACAGLRRLGREAVLDEEFPVDLLVPAAGQGALAVECRAVDGATRAVLAGLDDPASAAAVRAERAVLAGLGAGCTTPIGVHARVTAGHDSLLHIEAVVVSSDGGRAVRQSLTGDPADPAGAGARLAAGLLAAGAADLIAER